MSNKLNIILYGINELSIYLLQTLEKEKYNIIGFSDKENNATTDGINGMKIIPIDQLENNPYDYIIICSDETVDLKSIGNSECKVINLSAQLKEYLNIYNHLYYSNYDYNLLWANIEKAKTDPSCELFITGLSYAQRGIDETLLQKKSVKLSSTSQDLYYDYVIAKDILSVPHNFKYCILGMAYFSFDCDLSLQSESWRIGQVYYPLYRDCHHYQLTENYSPPIGINKISDYIHYDHPVIDQSLIIKCLIDVFKIEFDRPLDENIWNSPCDHLPIEQLGIKRASQHCKHNYEQTKVEYKQILKEYLDVLKENKITPIVVIFPTTHYYYNYFDERVRNNYYRMMNELNCSYNFQFFDYFKCNLFTIDEFSDCDHLNKKGAQKMTELLNSVICWSK